MTQAFSYGPFQFDSSGNLKTTSGGGGSSTITGAGTAGTPDTGVVTVQGIAGGTAQPMTITGPLGSQTVAASVAVNINGPYGDKTTTASLAVTSLAPTGTPTGVASSASSVTVLAANILRKGASLYNASTAILYALLSTGGTASNASGGYTIAIAPSGYYELPAGYTGDVIGIWASANGFVNVTEFTG